MENVERVWHVQTQLCVSENSVPHCTHWLMIIIPTKWLFNWEYTLLLSQLYSQYKPLLLVLLIIIPIIPIGFADHYSHFPNYYGWSWSLSLYKPLLLVNDHYTLMIIIPIKWLFHWWYTQHFQTQLISAFPTADPRNLPEVTPCTSVQDGLTAPVKRPRLLRLMQWLMGKCCTKNHEK